MDMTSKIVHALAQALKPEYVRLNDEGGISGVVVTRQFKGVSGLNRQQRIDEILNEASLTEEERRQIHMIAGLTPEEFDTVGTRIRVSKVTDMGGGGVEVWLQGTPGDAEYVRRALDHQKGVQTTEPKPVSGALGILMTFHARGTGANPLTKEKALRVLKKDAYIEVLSSA